jgi:hypothetical protein
LPLFLKLCYFCNQSFKSDHKLFIQMVPQLGHFLIILFNPTPKLSILLVYFIFTRMYSNRTRILFSLLNHPNTCNGIWHTVDCLSHWYLFHMRFIEFLLGARSLPSLSSQSVTWIADTPMIITSSCLSLYPQIWDYMCSAWKTLKFLLNGLIYPWWFPTTQARILDSLEKVFNSWDFLTILCKSGPKV